MWEPRTLAHMICCVRHEDPGDLQDLRKDIGPQQLLYCQTWASGNASGTKHCMPEPVLGNLLLLRFLGCSEAQWVLLGVAQVSEAVSVIGPESLLVG